jgi:(p)ppGpp synthase/HD superfamily hydrolase
MFSAHVERALRVAIDAHAGQVRKGSEPVAYISHPFHVALMLARLGYDDAVLQAGLLHDVVEDCEGWTIERVESEFGPSVREIVAELTEDKSKSWEVRKRDGVNRVTRLSDGALAVKAADKLHNLESLLADLRASDDSARVWARYNGGRERTLTMSSELVAALEARADPRIAGPLRKTLDEIVAMSKS